MLRGLFLAALIGVFSMDAGVGEAAVLEGAKAAGEAAAAEGALGAGALGAGEAAGAGALGAMGAGEAAGLGSALGMTEGFGGTLLPAASAGSSAFSGLPMMADASIATSALGDAGLMGGLGGLAGADLGATATAGGGSAPSVAMAPEGSPAGAGAGDAATTGAAPGAAPSATPVSAPLGAGGADIPGVSDPLTGGGSSAFSPNTFTGTPTTGYTPPDLTGALKASPVEPGMLDKILGAAKANPLQAANTGLGALSIAKQLGAGSSAQKQYNKAAGPTAGVSNQLLQQFQTGQISGADAFQITQFAQQQKAKIDQYYQKAGLSNSSMHQQALQQVDQQAEAMRQQAVQNLLKNGLSAAGVANPLIAQGITAGVNADAASMKAMQDFIAQLAKMNTPQASQTGSPTTPPPGP